MTEERFTRDEDILLRVYHRETITPQLDRLPAVGDLVNYTSPTSIQPMRAVVIGVNDDDTVNLSHVPGYAGHVPRGNVGECGTWHYPDPASYPRLQL